MFFSYQNIDHSKTGVRVTQIVKLHKIKHRTRVAYGLAVAEVICQPWKSGGTPGRGSAPEERDRPPWDGRAGVS